MGSTLPAFRTLLRLRLRALSSWGLWSLGVLLTAWGTLLDILAVGVEEGRARAIALTSGSLVAVLLGAGIGSNTPERLSLNERREPWAALVDAPWGLPTGRALVAAAFGGIGSGFCVLYTLVLDKHDVTPSLLVAGITGGLGALLASAWASVLAPRFGALLANGTVVALAVLSQWSPWPAARCLLPWTTPADALLPLPVLGTLVAAAGLLTLTARGVSVDRRDGRAGGGGAPDGWVPSGLASARMDRQGIRDQENG